jgi:hypothetical protein
VTIRFVFFAADDFRADLFILASLAAGYMVIAIAVFAALRRSPPPASFVGAVALCLAALVIAVAVFHAVALDRRPMGGTQGEFERFVDHARLVFIALYAGTMAFAAALGGILGRSVRSALLTTGLIAVFMVASFPFVEFQNSCDVGDSLFLSVSC